MQEAGDSCLGCARFVIHPQVLSRPGHVATEPAQPYLTSGSLTPGHNQSKRGGQGALGLLGAEPKLKSPPTSTSPARAPLHWHSFLGEGGIRKEEPSRSLPSQKPPPSGKRKHEIIVK